MSGTLKDWIAKAEHDYATANRELRISEEPNYDAVCFHAQQCIEKLMKGLIIQLKTVPPKTHDLVYLHGILSDVCQEWSWSINELRFLSRAAVDFRYPGEFADQEEAVRSLDIATRVKIKLESLIEQ